MPTYRASLEEVNFLLNEVFRIDRYNNLPGFSDASADVREAIRSAIYVGAHGEGGAGQAGKCRRTAESQDQASHGQILHGADVAGNLAAPVVHSGRRVFHDGIASPGVLKFQFSADSGRAAQGRSSVKKSEEGVMPEAYIYDVRTPRGNAAAAELGIAR
jgi:Acyl-CoA dehydrogenase N terminal